MHEFDKCIVTLQDNRPAAEGFVSAFDGTVIKFTANGAYDLLISQNVTIFIFNRVKGECVYKGTVCELDGKNVVFDRLTFVRSTQKRDNTRVDKTMHYRITHRFANGRIEKLEKPVSITILNISAQGMFMTSAADFAEGTRFPLVFKDAGKPINLEVQVLRCEKTRRGNSYGCRFLNINEKDADNIFRFVLHEQIVQRRNNLLI